MTQEKQVGTFVRISGHVGVVVGDSDLETVPEDHLAIWYGQTAEDNSPEVRTVPEEYCEPIDNIKYYH